MRALLRIVSLAMLLFFAGACSANPAADTSAGTGVGTTAPTSTTVAEPPPSTDPPGQHSFHLYWIRDCAPPETAGDVTTCRIGVGKNRLTDHDDLPNAAMAALMSGPDDAEKFAGLNSNIREVVVFHSLSIDGDGTATVDFNRYFETAKTRPQVAQVVYTLTQFPQIKRVRFLIDHMTNGATGVPALTREDIADMTPTILVEAPAFDARVDRVFKLSGRGSSPDGKVSYRVETLEGERLGADGNANIVAPPGKSGALTGTVSLPTEASGKSANLIVTVRESSGTTSESRVLINIT